MFQWSRTPRRLPGLYRQLVAFHVSRFTGAVVIETVRELWRPEIYARIVCLPLGSLSPVGWSYGGQIVCLSLGVSPLWSVSAQLED